MFNVNLPGDTSVCSLLFYTADSQLHDLNDN